MRVHVRWAWIVDAFLYTRYVVVTCRTEKPIRAVPPFSFYIMKLQNFKFFILFVCLFATTNINAISNNIYHIDTIKHSTSDKLENNTNNSNYSTRKRTIYSTKVESATATSIYVEGIFERSDGDAELKSETIALYADTIDSASLVAQVEGKEWTFTGLSPNTLYYVKHTIVAGITFVHRIPVDTKELTLTTAQPQVISNGNVIVSAETNIDDAETNIGFEWRRTDWTDDFASNRGEATLRNGIMEGYIFNLNTEKLWKYRPYYISNSGTYYYGEWVGIDPTNTPNDEPVIYTDETSVVEGNTAILKGYTSIDAGQLESQGFKYWKVTEETEDMEATIPMNAATVETSGQMMTANLTGLDYNSTYHYVAFVTTVEGETLYGKVHAFTIGEDPTGIEDIQLEPTEQNSVAIVARYNMSGQPISSPQKGINILRMSDGTARKVLVK